MPEMRLRPQRSPRLPSWIYGGLLLREEEEKGGREGWREGREKGRGWKGKGKGRKGEGREGEGGRFDAFLYPPPPLHTITNRENFQKSIVHYISWILLMSLSVVAYRI